MCGFMRIARDTSNDGLEILSNGAGLLVRRTCRVRRTGTIRIRNLLSKDVNNSLENFCFGFVNRSDSRLFGRFILFRYFYHWGNL